MDDISSRPPTTPDDSSEAQIAPPSFVRSFFQHGATYAVGGLLSQGISFLLFPFFVRVLSPRDYGILDLIGLVTTLVNLGIAQPLSQALGRHLAETEDTTARRSYASTALIFSIAVYTNVLVVAFVFSGTLTTLVLGRGVNPTIMKVGIASIWFNGLLAVTQGALRWQLRPKAFALVTVVTTGVITASSAVLVLGFKLQVTGALTGQLIGFAVAGVLAYALSADLYRFTFDRTKLTRMLSYGVPLLPASLGVFLNAYADRIAIRSQLSLTEVGIYGAGYRLSIIVSLTLLGFQGAMLPLVLARHEQQRTRNDLAKIFRLFCLTGLIVFICISVFAEELLRLLTRPAYYGASQVTPVLIGASFLSGMAVFAPGLNIARRMKTYGLVTAAFGVLNILLAFALVGPMGIRGPALAFLVACGGTFAVLMGFSQRVYHVPHAWGRIIPAGFVGIVLVCVLRTFLAGSLALPDELGKVAVTGLGLALITRMLLNHEELSSLMQLPQHSAEAVHSSLQKAWALVYAKHP